MRSSREGLTKGTPRSSAQAGQRLVVAKNTAQRTELLGLLLRPDQATCLGKNQGVLLPQWHGVPVPWYLLFEEFERLMALAGFP